MSTIATPKQLKEADAALAQSFIDQADLIMRTADGEHRERTPQERAKVAGLLEQHRSLMAAVDGDDDAYAGPGPGRRSAPQTPGAPGTGGEFENEAPTFTSTGRQLRSFRTERDAYLSGQFLLSQIWPDTQPGQRAIAWCREKGIELRAQSEGINAAGGWTVPDVMADAIIKNVNDFSAARKLCRVRQMTRDHLSIPKHVTGPTVSFVSENGEITAVEKTWGAVGLTPKKVACLTRVSSELDEDSIIEVAEDLAQDFGRGFAEKEEDCWINGDGLIAYGGMQGLKGLFAAQVGVYTGAVDALATHDLMSEVTAADMAGAVGTLPEYAHANASWLCSRVFWGTVMNRLSFAASGIVSADYVLPVPMSFMGYPVVLSSKCPSVLTAINNTPMCYFGDFSRGCEMGVRRDVSIKVDASRYLEFDQLAVRGTSRFDIVNHDIGSATVAGPVVALMGNA